MRQRFPDPLALNVHGRQSQGYAGNARKSQATRKKVINIVGEANENQPRAIRCYNCKGECHMAKQCIAKKGVKDAEWFKEKEWKTVMIFSYKQHQISRQTMLMHMADYDDEATACAIFMASLSPAETKYIEHFVSNNDSYDELTSENNVISYADYMVTIENDDAQYVLPYAQDNAMIFYVIEQMKFKVEIYNTVNQETKSVNKSLSNELERYKEKIKVLEAKHNSKEFLTKREEFLDFEMRGIIVDRNKKVEAFEKQVIVQRQQIERIVLSGVEVGNMGVVRS
nr:hypothetical protein [Tanacetum cinerariifolium]